MATAALITLDLSVTTSGADIDRARLAATLGAWIDALPDHMRQIETVNADGDRVYVTIRTATGAR